MVGGWGIWKGLEEENRRSDINYTLIKNFKKVLIIDIKIKKQLKTMLSGVLFPVSKILGHKPNKYLLQILKTGLLSTRGDQVP